jgi:LPXTG-motif cell wall-anchored protein
MFVGKLGRLCALGALCSTAIVLSSGTAAHATAVTPTCDSFAIDANGNPVQPPIATGNELAPLDIPNLGAGNVSVPTGTTFPVTTPSGSTSLPASATVKVGGNPATVSINEIKNIGLHFKISGAASVTQPILSGGNVLGASATTTVSSLTLTLPGTKTGSTLPKGSAFFPGGSSFTTPSISLKVTAPNSPGTISTSLDSMNLLTSVSLGTTKLGVYLDCTVAANTLGSVNVVEPGAPVAVDDSAAVDSGRSVKIDVLKNDKPNDQGQPLDPSTLSIIKPPAHGTATVTSDHEILYKNTPGPPFPDSFQYQVCVDTAPATTTTSAPQVAAVDSALKCDPATVSITVETTACACPAVGVLATSTTTVAPAELPRTGSTTTPLIWIAVGLCTIGLAGIGLARRRTA